MTQATPTTVVYTATSTSLLMGLGESSNRDVWQQFVDRYRPIIAGYARRRGLDRDDSEDAAQETLLGFAKAYQDGRYDRERGRLRGWLFSIAHNQVMRILRTRYAQSERDNERRTEDLDATSDADALDERWEQEWQQGVLRACLQEIRGQVEESTIQAFELHAWKGWPAKQVARELGMTENAVFLAKHKILRRIRDLLPQMESIF